MKAFHNLSISQCVNPSNLFDCGVEDASRFRRERFEAACAAAMLEFSAEASED
jgi:hypothetical protein